MRINTFGLIDFVAVAVAYALFTRHYLILRQGKYEYNPTK